MLSDDDVRLDAHWSLPLLETSLLLLPLRVQLLHFLLFLDGQFRQVPNEIYQFPGILFIMTGAAAPRRHPTQSDSILNNVEQFAVCHLLSRRQAHIRSRWISS